MLSVTEFGVFMSNFADLVQPEKFVGQAVGTPNQLRNKVFLGAAAIAALVAGAGFFAFQSHGTAQVAPTPPLAVTVERVQPQTIHPFAEFSGRISAVDYAEIRPQVVGPHHRDPFP